jgi:hypothetical protein
MSDKKNEKPARLANIVEVSRVGEKVIGQIDRRTGEIIGGAATAPKSSRSTPKDSDK